MDFVVIGVRDEEVAVDCRRSGRTGLLSSVPLAFADVSVPGKSRGAISRHGTDGAAGVHFVNTAH